MPNINNDNNMRIYDFNTLKKSFKIQDVSKIKDYTIPEENLPHVKDQGDICCCVACVLAEMLEVFNKIETGEGGTGEDQTNPPAKPKVEIVGTQGEAGYYRSEVELKVTANDRADTLT